MKLVELKCPGCGSLLNVDMESRQAFCQFCGASLPVEDEHPQIDGEKLGYDFEMGRKKAEEELEKKAALDAEMARRKAEYEEAKRKTNKDSMSYRAASRAGAAAAKGLFRLFNRGE